MTATLQSKIHLVNNKNFLREFIEIGEKKMETQAALAKYLDLYDSSIRHAKQGKIGLPLHACILLADLVGEERQKIIAASSLITEKNPDRRKLLLKCVQPRPNRRSTDRG